MSLQEVNVIEKELKVLLDKENKLIEEQKKYFKKWINLFNIRNVLIDIQKNEKLNYQEKHEKAINEIKNILLENEL
jgi:hypothetical protein